ALTFNATPTTGYSVNQWLVDGTVAQSGGTSFTLSNITANHSLQVTFAINQYTVTPGAGSNGTISPNTPQTVVYQGALTFNATPATNYTVNQWLVDGTVAQTRGASFTLNNITANHTVQVTFSLATAVLTAVGQDYTGALAALVAVSNDGAGNTWSTKTITGLPNNSAFVSASCTGSDATAICAAAGYTNASGTIFPLLVVSTDGGNTWAIKTITGFTTQGNLQGVNCIGTGSTAICVATGEESLVGGGDGPAIIAVSVDGGNTWNTKPVTGLSSAGFFQPVSCTGTGSTAICVAAGEDVTGTYPPQIAVSTDGGNTWAIKTLDGITTIGQFYSVSCTGTGITAICAAVGADNGGSSQPPILTVSTDGGNTWVAQTIQGTTVNGYLMGVSCTGTGITTICAAAGGTTDTQEPLIAASTDGGNTWTKQVATNLPSTGDFSMVSCTGTGNNAICTAAGQRLDNYGPLIVSSTDGANTWTTNSIPGLTTTGQFNSASCTGSGASAICTAAGHQDFSSSSPPILVISTDGANTWAIKNIPDLPATGNFGSTGATGGN
ncbi:MAG: sialidase family protein, partial [Gammaproteobacteria bacterium]|nr:sialidase family protein [Gammaproteobacteria bacterium]